MALNRCKHGVYDPDGTAQYCSICTTPEPIPEEDRKLIQSYNPFPYGERKCPNCGSPRFVFKNDYDWHCRDCGFDALKD